MKKIFITSLYERVFATIFLIIIIISIFIFNIVFKLTDQNKNIFLIINIILIMILLLMLVCVVFVFQYAKLNDIKLEIRCLFFVFSCFKWSEIEKLSLKKVESLSTFWGVKYYQLYIIIDSKNNCSKHNKIYFNKRNSNVLINFIKNKNFDINVDEIQNYINLTNI